MSKSGISVFVFGLYQAVLGITLVAVPNFLLGIFSIPAATDVWIRIMGVLLLVLSFYYIQASRKGLTDFFRWTIFTRCGVLIFFIAFVLLGFVQPILILFGVVELLGAIWTGLALRSSKKPVTN